ncbi:MAG TPA: hypothetical protein VG013_00500 [Gemmataceae bacterium]|nr:hypothetical protein [Gemmataceae bacterium]
MLVQNMCPNPGCGAAYSITPQHIGRRLTCKKCGASLVVEPNGLQLADAVVAAEPAGGFEDMGGPSPSRRAYGQGSAALQSIWGRITEDVPTFLFGIGAVLVIVYLFYPLIDQAKETRAQAQIEAGDRRLAESLQGDKGSGDDAKKKTEDWEKKKKELQKDVDDLRVSNRRAIYWYMWGMMLGFLCLAIAAIGYLSPRQTTTRRVVGSIIICAEVVLIFMTFVFSSATSFHGR